MKDSELHRTVNRILFGRTLVDVGEKLYLYKPTPEYRYLSSELYEDVSQEAYDRDMLTQDELQAFLYGNDLWSKEEELKLKELPKSIEELKCRMYERFAYDSQALKVSRGVLRRATEDVMALTGKKHSYDFLSVNGFAELERNRFLVAASLYRQDNTSLLTSFDDYWRMQSWILDRSIVYYRNARVDETSIRYIARNDPWRTLWVSRKSEQQFFGVPTHELTEDQRNLVIWSGLYDSIAEHPECPPQKVVDDDDVLDGWMISQRRKREKELKNRQADDVIGNDKIRDSSEIFIPVKTREDFEEVVGLNDFEATMKKRERMALLNKKGQVSEAEMPDSKQIIMQKWTEMYKERVKG